MGHGCQGRSLRLEARTLLVCLVKSILHLDDLATSVAHVSRRITNFTLFLYSRLFYAIRIILHQLLIILQQ